MLPSVLHLKHMHAMLSWRLAREREREDGVGSVEIKKVLEEA